MATPAFVPELTAPAVIVEKRGVVAEMIKHKRARLLHELQINGRIKPAVLLNLSPFSLKIESGLIDKRIPPCPVDKDFAVYKLERPITYPIFTGAREQHDQSIRQEWDVKAILPVEQLMEYERAYSMDTSQEGVAYGGIVVFEGTPDQIRTKGKVNRPYYDMQGRDRFLMFEEVSIGDLIERADAQLKIKCMNMINEAQSFTDGNEDQRRNRTPDYNTWADFALRKKWISKLPAWRSAEATSMADLCSKCGDRYISTTGVCKCGFVMYPLVALENGEITAEHTRLDTLNPEQWAKAKKIIAERKKARE
jgi:hypothetical protein